MAQNRKRVPWRYSMKTVERLSRVGLITADAVLNRSKRFDRLDEQGGWTADADVIEVDDGFDGCGKTDLCRGPFPVARIPYVNVEPVRQIEIRRQARQLILAESTHSTFANLTTVLPSWSDSLCGTGENLVIERANTRKDEARA